MEDLSNSIKEANKRFIEKMHYQGLTYNDIAYSLGVSNSAVSAWLHTKVPEKRCRSLSRIVNGDISINELRPDLFK